MHPIGYPVRWRVVGVLAALGTMASILGPAGAASAAARREGAGLADQRARDSRMSLSQVPSDLRAAVRRTLRTPDAAAGFQQAELTASDGNPGDFFGYSVAVSGDLAVVGAPNRNSFTGAAFVFARKGSNWSQQGELTAADAAAGDRFGWAVAISKTTAVVGAWGKNSFTGAAYVFVRSGKTWGQQAKLTAPDGAANDAFGLSIALSGSTAVVGAPDRNSNTGAAYVFVRSGTIWSQQAELTASDGVPFDSFGVSVALSGSYAVVGAFDRNSTAGSAYVFVRSGSVWSQQAELTASDGAPGDYFGASATIDGSVAIVGAYGKDSDTGAAYVFARSGSVWSQQAKLTAADGVAGDYFGESVGVSGSIAVVGAYGQDSNTGAAYVFVKEGSAWPQQAELTAADGVTNDHFGLSVGISGSTIVSGADRTSSNTGTAYVFVLPSQQAKLTASNGASPDSFGGSVAISGSTAVVGAFLGNSGTGAAYVFVRSGTTWSQQAELTASDSVVGDVFGGSVAISGSYAVIGARGKSPGGVVYVFVRSGTVWSQQAEFSGSDVGSGDGFGISVAIDGSTAVVGAKGRTTASGTAYVFVRSGTVWSQQAKIAASDGVPGDAFGTSVAISGSRAIVGAQGRDTATGAAYVFLRSGKAWSQEAELNAADGAHYDSFGLTVAISGSIAIVGAFGHNSETGAAYAFARSGTVWSQEAELTASDGAANDQFGWSVALDGSTAIIGAQSKTTGTGAAYVFVRSGTAWSEQWQLTASDGMKHDFFGGSVAISGATALVGAFAKKSSTGAAYVFVDV